MTKKFLILIIFILPAAVFAQNVTDEQIVAQIADLLISEYDNYKDKSFTERLVLKLGKRAFIDSVRAWQRDYPNVRTMPIKLHYQLAKMASIMDGCADEPTAKRFRELLTELTRIGYLNLDIYYRAVRKTVYDNGGILTSNITLDTIDYAVADVTFYEEKISMYDEEQRIKDEMRSIMRQKGIKHKIAFYSFAFEFFDKIRVKVIAADLEKVKANMEKKGG